jgi:hypothetical protein
VAMLACQSGCIAGGAAFDGAGRHRADPLTMACWGQRPFGPATGMPAPAGQHAGHCVRPAGGQLLTDALGWRWAFNDPVPAWWAG